ncbi:MAG: hypothetical protein WBX22_15780 [Silvibacterium sp.]
MNNTQGTHEGGEEREHAVYLSTQIVEMFRELKYSHEALSWFYGPGVALTLPFAKNALNKALEG